MTMEGAPKPLIMSVDDDRAVQRIIERYLSSNNCDVVFANSGMEALSMLKIQKPDIILLDVNMPGMDGYEVCAALQGDKDTAYIPVIFATAQGEERDKARAFAVGAADYIVKPFQKAALLGKVAAHLNTKVKWLEMSRTDGLRKDFNVHADDFTRFKTFLCGQEGLDGAGAKAVTSAPAGEVYSACLKQGIKSGVVAQHIAEFMRLPYMTHINPKDVLLGVLPTRFCRSNSVVALADVGADVAFVLSNPFDWQLHDAFARFSDQGQSYRLLVTEPDNIGLLFEIAEATSKGKSADIGIVTLAQKGRPTDADSITGPEDADAGSIDDLAASAQKAPVIKLANALISKAVHISASDIHIEPRENSVGVRYRIDGMLIEGDPIPKKLQAPLISRLKIMANMDISERRLPQDGRIRIAYHGNNIDLRASSLPSRFGETIVIRILDRTAVSLDFDALGFEEKALEQFRRSIKKPHGIILVTGPTGSGKSTTLYTALQALNEPGRNIVTVEDPIEYEMHRLTQIQVHPDIGLTFPSALRSILRQDPDVIMIGEIRDRETMDIAVRAALTGHLVLSTLHTNGAASTVVRLVDMGMEPYLVAASLELIMAQRLLRRLCPDCRKPVEAPPGGTFEQYKVAVQPGMEFYQASGCERCNGSGYKGRLAAIEVMPVDDEMRRMIAQKAGVDRFFRHAVDKCGMTTLQQSAFLKAAHGLTSLEEVMRITG